MKIFISAAEASSDTHAAEALKRLVAIARSRGQEVQAFGIGGPRLREAGLQALFRAEDFLAMGFVEVLGKIPRLRKRLGEIEKWAARERPEVAVLCDYPEFHFQLAARLRTLGIRTICYIPPKVWVWRRSRLRFLATNYDRVLSILPFEESVYAGSGVSFRYVGNPLMDELPLSLTREAARERLGIAPNVRTLLLMVGSRPSEFDYHLEPMIEAAYRVRAKYPGEAFRVLAPLPMTANLEEFRRRIDAAVAKLPAELRSTSPLDLRASLGDAWTAMKASDAGLVKSGTSSLEAALLDCPHVVVYRGHPVSQFLFKHVVRYRRAISLTNLIGAAPKEEKLVPELILENFTVERMVQQLLPLFDGDAGERQRRGFARIREILGSTSPSEKVAEEILSVANATSGGA